ncbi:hypothetical protein M0R45_001955 [Rubus argutus]|uniref:Cytochrome P450 n=1 Tax=Rubus argutus TaxID=59490 RepID=A0AAW1VKT7_RUBAR
MILCALNPDRWNNPAKPGTYQVFGGGPRICAGNMLVRLQLAIFLTSFVRWIQVSKPSYIIDVIHYQKMIFSHYYLPIWWKLLNPDADMMYLPHPRPVDNVEITFSKI